MAEALGVASSVIAVVDLSVKVLSLCFQYSRAVKNAKDDIEKLGKEVATFRATTEELQTLIDGSRGQELKASQQLKSAIEDGRLKLKKLEQQLQPSTGRKRINRFGLRALKWPFESKDVKGTIEDLERCRENISLALNIDQTVILQNVNDRTTLNQLPAAEGASFDSYAEEHNPTCLPNTREELLREIYCWIDDPKSKTIFWLNGKAGTGKSTISRTVARSRYKQGDLGASFFFKRGEIDRGNLSKFVSTVARRLAWSMPAVEPFIKSAVNADPAIADKAVREQFEKLIREPLSKATLTSSCRPSVVIVVDALDECERDADITLILQLFSNLRFTDPLRVRVLVTSRPELPIRLGFSSISNAHQDLVLHKISQLIIEHDISVFLRHEFANIRNNFNKDAVEELKLQVDWPGEPNLEKLTRAAVPLFIFAATLCRFIDDRYLGSPDELLQRVLKAAGAGQGSKLDMTYSPVLSQQVLNRSESERLDIIESFRLIVGAIVTLANPLSMRALALLLDVHVSKVTTRLSALHSVLDIPETLDAPVRLLHLSFRDYLVSLKKRELAEFRVEERHTHQSLAKHCLRIMRGGLRKNVCGLSFPGLRRSSLDSGQLEKRMPSQLQYACMHWVYHQTSGKPELSDGKDVYGFLTTHFLHWLEGMCLLGRVKECLDALRSLARWTREDSSLSTFVADAERFVQAYFSVVAEMPLQIYCCLAFAPRKSVVRKTFKHAIPKWISNLPTVEENWDACLLTLEGHSNSVSSVVFSHNSKKVASGSDDETIRIWNAETGECERELKGHSSSVSSVVFSYNSKKVASGSYDGTIRIWNAETGECEQELKGHSSSVSSVVFSHDSKKVASGSYDKMIRIWNAETGKCERELEGHSSSVSSVVFSHNSKKVASGSYDRTIRIWNAETGECERELKGHSSSVSSVVFSYNSKKVASGSYDGTIRIWNAETGECEQELKGHSGSVSSVVFSYDLKKVASGSYDKIIRIWNAETGECEQELKGHSGSVSSVVFSYNSKKVASGSYDRTIRIWNAETGECERELKGHSSSVSSVVFSYNSKKVASGSYDKMIRIWNAETGECERELKGYSSLVSLVVFSHDSKKVASGSYDGIIRIWNAETGKYEQELKDYSSSVSSVVFSHDFKKVALGSYDGIIWIWNTETGEYEQELKGHSNSVSSVVFSHNSKKVASGSDDETIRIWNAETGECERELKGHSSSVSSVVFSYNSKKVASGSYDRTIRIWNAETGECEQELKGHSGSVSSVVFSHDLKKVASGSYDGTIWIWNAETGDCEEIVPFNGYACVLSFATNGCGIVTDRGVFALSGGSQPYAGSTMPWQSSDNPMLACTDSTWITAAGKDLLWLPPECRNGEVAVSGSKVAIGCQSGRVLVLGISMAEVERWTDTGL